jgi:hypothetical protein
MAKEASAEAGIPRRLSSLSKLCWYTFSRNLEPGGVGDFEHGAEHFLAQGIEVGVIGVHPVHLRPILYSAENLPNDMAADEQR